MRKILFAAAALVTFYPSLAMGAGFADPPALRATFEALAAGHPGRVGICVQHEAAEPICVNGDQRFSLQSVMKLVVGVAVIGGVDEGKLALGDAVTVRREDLSANIQPIADIVAEQGAFHTSIGDLVSRAVIESDSAATDVLIGRLGGIHAVQQFMLDAGIEGINIDRYERELQAETSGLTWQPHFVFPETFQSARKNVPARDKQAAFEAYLKDERDTATPLGMTGLLSRLAARDLLSAPSTEYFLSVMAQTRTFPDRLRAGIPKGWKIGHKTGTSQTLAGVNGVTNDVGIMIAPGGGVITISAFVA